MLPLNDILVIAIEQAVAAPLCTSRLSSAGARVIKVERSEGDFARKYDIAAKGESSYFTWLNQGKESVCLDFKNEPGASLLRNMIKKADVVIQNLAPGAFARSGFSTEELYELNPSLVVCNISGYGDTGEAATKRAYDLLIQAESGIVSVSGSPEGLGRVGVSICDIGAGVTAYSAILEALLKRYKTGQGQEVSVSLFDVAAEWMAVPHIHAQYGEGAPQPVGLKHPSIAPYGAFKCSDERLILISIQNNREWIRLCEEVLESSALAEEQHYKDNNDRVAHLPALEKDINAIVSTLTSEEFQRRLENAKIAYGAINSASDLLLHPAFRPSDATTTSNEKIVLPAHPVRWRNKSNPKPTKTPALGEHTDSIFNEFSEAPT